MRRTRARSRAFTLIEMLVAMALGTLIVMGAYKFMSTMQENTGAAENNAAAQAENRLVLDLIKKNVGNRLTQGPGDPLPLELLASTGFSPSGPGNCQDLRIRTRVAGGAIRTFLYRTECVDGPSAGASRPFPTSACGANKRSQLVLTEYVFPNETAAVSTRTWPVGVQLAGAALCAVDESGTNLRVNLSGLYRVGKTVQPAVAEQLIPLNDRAAGVEYRPE